MDEYVERGVWRVTIALHVPYGNNDGYAWNLGSRASVNKYDVTDAVDVVVVRIALDLCAAELRAQGRRWGGIEGVLR